MDTRTMRLLFSVAATALIAGCTVGPNYTPPKISVAPAYGEMPAEQKTNQPSRLVPETESLRRWWTVFHDGDLDSLIDRASNSNRDLLLALERVRQALAQRGVVASGLLPEIDATAGYDHARGSQNVKIPVNALEGSSGGSGGSAGAGKSRAGKTDEASANAPAGGPNSPFGLGGLPGANTDLYQMGLDTSWQIDVFGGTRREIEAAKANIIAAEEDRRAALVSLLAQVATNYLDLRLLQERLDLARNNLAAQEEILDVVRARVTNGLATELDFAQQTAQVSSTAATIAPLESSEHDDMHTLGFLLGDDPMAVAPELSQHRPLPEVPPEVPVGIPSDLLRRRADVRRAERQLAAATAQVGSATADLFPKFSLTGLVGLDSSQPGNLIDWGSRYFAISPGVSWPILDWGRIRSNIRVQNALQAQALTAYEQTVSGALKEVEDALVHYQEEQTRHKDLAEAFAASQTALELARKSYENGVVDILTVLNAERSLLASQDTLVQSDGAIRKDLVRLYVALGGGWEQ
jgi:outer membrane protein, multidrug efflux system